MSTFIRINMRSPGQVPHFVGFTDNNSAGVPVYKSFMKAVIIQKTYNTCSLKYHLDGYRVTRTIRPWGRLFVTPDPSKSRLSDKDLPFLLLF